MTDYHGVTPEICDRAYDDIVKHAVMAAADRFVINKRAGSLLVLRTDVPYEPKYKNAILDGNFEDLVLWEHQFGTSDVGAKKIQEYIAIARAKAFTTYLTGLPSHLVQQQFPSLYVPGMTKYGGSAVAGVGPMRLITAFSGVQWNFDQMISEFMISAITAICHEEMRAVMAQDEAMILLPASED